MKNKCDTLTTQNLKFLKNKIVGNSNFSYVQVLFARNLSKWKYFRKKWANCWGSKVSEKLVEGKIIFFYRLRIKNDFLFLSKNCFFFEKIALRKNCLLTLRRGWGFWRSSHSLSERPKEEESAGCWHLEFWTKKKFPIIYKDRGQFYHKSSNVYNAELWTSFTMLT